MAVSFDLLPHYRRFELPKPETVLPESAKKLPETAKK
jgi:hypothetical protein